MDIAMAHYNVLAAANQLIILCADCRRYPSEVHLQNSAQAADHEARKMNFEL